MSVRLSSASYSLQRSLTDLCYTALSAVAPSRRDEGGLNEILPARGVAQRLA